jgi:hypothetical protein
MAKDAGWIMFLLKDCGGLLNMNVYIFKNLIMFTNFVAQIKRKEKYREKVEGKV